MKTSLLLILFLFSQCKSTNNSYLNETDNQIDKKLIFHDFIFSNTLVIIWLIICGCLILAVCLLLRYLYSKLIVLRNNSLETTNTSTTTTTTNRVSPNTNVSDDQYKNDSLPAYEEVMKTNLTK
jgi:predicted membrane protein